MTPKVHESQLEKLTKQQWKVVSRQQLIDLGYKQHQIRSLQARGLLHRRHRGVFSYGHRDIPWQGVLLAAQLACGKNAYLTGQSALALHGLRKAYLGEVEVAVAALSRPRIEQAQDDTPKLKLHSTSSPPRRDELCHTGALTYASLARILVEMAARASAAELEKLITKAIRAGKLNHAQMQMLLERHANRPGIAKLKRAYAYYLPRPSAKSGLEDSFDAAIAARPAIPEPQRNVEIKAGGIKWEIDRYFAEERVAVELDGRQYHDAKQDRERDNVKDLKLGADGILVVRITDTRWEHDREGALDDLEDVLSKRRPRAA